MTTAIYGRQSLDKKDSISIDTQIELCKGELSDSETFQIYTDKGFSGKNTNRPGFQQMMQDVEDGIINRIIIYRLDRISRSISDFADIIDVLEAHEVSFTSVNEKFDTSTPMGRAMIFIIMVFAQLERETIAERIKDNYYQRGKTGCWLGGPAPFGYKIEKIVLNGKKLSVLRSVKELDIVTKLFFDYANTGKSLGELAKSLTDTYGKTYGAWTNVRLSRILHNPIYVKADADIYNYYNDLGCILVNEVAEYDGLRSIALYGKRDRGANKYNALSSQVATLSLTEGIIDSDVFLRCQYKLSKNKQIKNSGKGKYTWMTGLVKCSKCGYSMTVKTYNNKKYLYCSGRQNLNTCTNAPETIYLDEVELIADEMVRSYLEKIDRTTSLKRKNQDNTEANEIKIELHNINEQIDNLISALTGINGAATDYVNKKINELDSKKQILLEKLSENAVEKLNIKIPTAEEWITSDRNGKRELSQLIIDKISVSKNSVDIVWKY